MYNGYQNQFFQKELWGNGPVPGQFYNFPGGNYNAAAVNPALREYTAPGLFGNQRSATAITTGSSVLGIKFDSGVMIAADTLVSYGSLARYQNVNRIFKLNDFTIIGAGGDYADFQSLKRSIDQKITEDTYHQDNYQMQPKMLYNWLTRVLYNRRSNLNPFLVDIVVGGFDNGAPYLGHVDLRGRSFNADAVATGLGRHLALPLMREKTEGKILTQQEASDVLRKCMEVLYYRDCRTMSKYTVAVCTKEGAIVQGPFTVDQTWEVANMVKGYN